MSARPDARTPVEVRSRRTLDGRMYVDIVADSRGVVRPCRTGHRTPAEAAACGAAREGAEWGSPALQGLVELVTKRG